jgi:CMP-N-acetylneuraminic acid synthetase
MKKVTAILPMKGHSERVPRKNLRMVCGKPLYHWVMKSMQDSEFIDEVVVETDSDEIEEDAKLNFDVRVIRRPDRLLGDAVDMNSLLEYHLSIIESDIYLQTHATNPLLTAKTIDAAILYYTSIIDNFDSLFSVTRLQTRLYFKDGSAINHNPAEMLQTQNLPIVFEENSNIYLFTKQSFMKNKRRIGETPYMYELNKLEAIDIDEMEDLLLAESLLSKEC